MFKKHYLCRFDGVISANETKKPEMVSLFAELVNLMVQMVDLSDRFQDIIFKSVVFSDFYSSNWEN